MERRSAVLVFLIAFVAVECTTSPPGGRPSTGNRPTSSRVVVTRDDPSLPPNCRPAAVATLVDGFFDALNGSSPSLVDRFFAPPPKFTWYSVTEGGSVDERWHERPTYSRSQLLLGPHGRGRHFVTYEPQSLSRYLAERQAEHERMTLLAIKVGGQLGPPHPEAGFEYVIERSADDLEEVGVAAGLAEGKGAIDCDRGKIFVWSMGMEEPPAPFAHESLKILCPAPASPTRPKLAVACARG